MTGKLFIISASSGVGKTTLVSVVLQKLQLQYPKLDRVITYTTKMNRPGEKHGEDYYFLTKKEFEEKIEQDFFLEWSTAYGSYYGSPRYILRDIAEGQSRIVILDREGAKQVALLYPSVVLIWLYTSDFQALSKRLITRGTDSPEQIEKRLVLAQQELEAEKKSPFYHYYIRNDTLNEAVKEFEIILQKECGIVL